MKYKQYKYNFYLNASHAIYINGEKGERHPHTWEISLFIVNNKDTFIKFSEVEKQIENYLSQFQEKYINDCPLFHSINPTLENIAQCLIDELQKILNPLSWVIFTMEISETPSRSYIISKVDNNIISHVETRNIAAEILKKNGFGSNIELVEFPETDEPDPIEKTKVPVNLCDEKRESESNKINIPEIKIPIVIVHSNKKKKTVSLIKNSFGVIFCIGSVFGILHSLKK